MGQNLVNQSKNPTRPTMFEPSTLGSGLASLYMERVMGIEPTYSAWKAEVLPLNYTRLAGAPFPGLPEPI